MTRDRRELEGELPHAPRHTPPNRTKVSAMAGPSGAPHTVRNPVRTKVTLDGDAEPQRDVSVFCKIRGQSLSLDACKGCARLVAMPESTAGHADVTCQASSITTAKAADFAEKAARISLSELGRRRFACVKRTTPFTTLETLLLDDELAALPVVDDDERPIGIVTREDLLRCERDGADEVTSTELPHATHVDLHPDATAGEVMTPHVHVLPEDAPISFALALLAMENTDAVPIVGDRGHVTGLFTSRDAVRWVAQELGYVVHEPGG